MTHTTASKVKSAFCKFLRFLNLVDRNCDLSITNIAVITLITKIAIAPTIDWQAAGALMVALLNYSHKRSESNKAEAKASEVAKLAAVEAAKPVVSLAELEEIKANYAELKAQHEQVSKIADKAKEFMSSQSVARGFQAPVRKPGQN